MRPASQGPCCRESARGQQPRDTDRCGHATTALHRLSALAQRTARHRRNRASQGFVVTQGEPMGKSIQTVLAVGASGSIGRPVVEEALAVGYRVRALVRDASKARLLPAAAEIAIGDVTRPETLAAAVDGIDAVVFTLGSDGQGKEGAETIDYG